MIISFDLDNTLIPYADEFPTETRTFFQQLFRSERLRKGTIHLFKELKKQNHDIWVYTTSYRNPLSIRTTFATYGLWPSKIINEEENQKVLRRHNCTPTKNPKLFGIDIHIDDSKGLQLEGKRYGFKIFVLESDDEQWTQQVLDIISGFDEQNIP